MNRIYGVTFAGSEDTDDGTGINQAKLALFLRTWYGPKLTVRICVESDVHPRMYRPICDAIRAAGHKVLLEPIDSEAMSEFSVSGYGRRFATCLNYLGGIVDYVECANEISGSRGDSNWPGPKAFEKMVEALRIAQNVRLPRVVTLFWNNDDPNWTWEWCDKHAFQSEMVFMSNYQLSTPEVSPTPVGEIISHLAARFPHSAVGFGEYGCENADGEDVSSDKTRADMIREFDGRKITLSNDIGGGFQWDAYDWMVSKPNKALISTYMTSVNPIVK